MVVPAGLPGWITVELIEKTLRVWQRFYEARLTVDDAVAILLDTGQLLDALSSPSGSRS
ncbi:hypothetical protein Pan44_51460 [Caulifigura coniformis]|uniref:Uncharacterized protein n=2 Tax=Caulifigura coniformis TaxID=2527983 RepID=A0A517SLT7_9PLAN|nr:hypothetical protein Pan44_51460 [Caulifigura coniformis]